MTIQQDARHQKMAASLRSMLAQAPIGATSAIHHLFGILYARELRDVKGYELDYIAGLAGSEHSMGREIGKGRNLARFVEVKPEYRNWSWGTDKEEMSA